MQTAFKLMILLCCLGFRSLPETKILLQSINTYRESRGLRLVKYRSDLDCAAQVWADRLDVLKICGHVDTNGAQVWDRIRDCNGHASAEIVACNFQSIDLATQGWIASPGHNGILLNPSLARAGVGISGFKDPWPNIGNFVVVFDTTEGDPLVSQTNKINFAPPLPASSRSH